MKTISSHHLLLFVCLMLGSGSTAWREADPVLPGSDKGSPVSTVFSLTPDGYVPVWLVAGPFEQPLEGFGEAVDTDMIGESTITPVAQQLEETTLVEGGRVPWKPVYIGENGFIDFHAPMGWVLPDGGPERIWKAKVGYAFSEIHSPTGHDAVLKVGSNSSVKVVLNGEVVHAAAHERDAEPDTDHVRVRLHGGRNTLLIKVGQTHRNEAPQFFGETRYEWGFYSRIVDSQDNPIQGLTASVATVEKDLGADLVSTFFFKGSADSLRQRFDLVLSSPLPEPQGGEVRIMVDGHEHHTILDRVPFGESRHAVYLPAVTGDTRATLRVTVGSETTGTEIVLQRQPHYRIYLAMMSHTDIGYTNTQPIVKERHLRTLDDVIERCEQDSTFAWTIETVWQLEQYYNGRPSPQFERLMVLVRSGRIAVSPVYTNPYTGWVGAEEMMRSFDKGLRYASDHGLRLSSAIYNDVPGLSWFLPQVLEQRGVSFLVTGINEVYSDYSIQRSLPKAFYWRGSGGGKVLTYRTEAYNEGQTLGLEKGVDAVPLRLWERLHRLRAQGYKYDVVLAVHTFGDNGIIPWKAPETTAAWNAAYIYPHIEVSHIAAFAEEFLDRAHQVPTLSGDWTSTWDVLYQGEPARMVRQRRVQHQVLTAEKMATLSWMLDQRHDPLDKEVDMVYDNLLHFGGHGSGLEYGYGSPKDNLTTMAFREHYVQRAVLGTVDVLERAAYRLSAREESFEGEALYVFNALNWTRDAPVEVEFPIENEHQYRAIDLSTGREIVSRYTGHTLRFVARDLPPVGYKKVRLERTATATPGPGYALQTDACLIQNAFYRIEADCATGNIVGFVARPSGAELVDTRSRILFNAPVNADSLLSLEYKPMAADSVRTLVRDERPVRLVLVTERPGHLFRESSITLWEDLDRVDVEHSVDLELLRVPDQFEDYSVAFPIALPGAHAAVDVLGGFLDPVVDRFPGITHDAFSLRRGVTVYNDLLTVSLSAADSRVIRIRETPHGPVIIANLVNNFPEDWNRWEENEGQVNYRFSITSREGAFNSAAAGRVGWAFSTPPEVRYTWLRSSPAEESFLEIVGESVVLMAMKPAGDRSGVELTLLNMDPKSAASARIRSSRLDIHSGELVARRTDGTPLEVDQDYAFTVLPGGAVQTVKFGLQTK